MEAPVFAVLRRATLQETKLHGLAATIVHKTAAQAWSLDSNYIFFDKRLYILAALPLLPNLIDALISDNRQHNLNYLAVGIHGLPTLATQRHTTPSSILLTCS